MSLFQLDAMLEAEAPVQIQEEPALEIAMPQVFEQPLLTEVRRGKLSHVERLIMRLVPRVPSLGLPSHQEQSGQEVSTNGSATLGPEYQDLVNEFQPLLRWAYACWDYLLSTEGLRFLRRRDDEKFGCRGDYRAFTDRDFSRLIHRIFRRGVMEFAHQVVVDSFSDYLKATFWTQIVLAYQRLEDPPDPRQRKLTPYSYLRCVPYRFLNDFHQELVYSTVKRLPADQLGVIDCYFLHFFTEQATAEALKRPPEACGALMRQGLLSLLIHHRLVYCLLRQIERY